MHLRIVLWILALLVLAAPDQIQAGEFIVPHQPGDTITIHVRPELYAHPVDYWWQKDPSSQGSWDYFTPVAHLHQPVKLETPHTDKWQGTIPVTNQPLR
ncbi:MAG: hypothetical protein G8237_11370 [Magnetococcales bacterium]|nr:hypothetical protein [Magnetococcales bacterium]